MKKAWCKTAELILDHLRNGCELIVCIHGSADYERHAYVWHKEQGRAIRKMEDTFAAKFVTNGFVHEISRIGNNGYCNGLQFGGEWNANVWKVHYRVTEEQEDQQVQILHNREREAIFRTLINLRDRQEELEQLLLPSNATMHLLQQLQTINATATQTLANSPVTAQQGGVQ
jgi:hypothetical protein